MKKLSYLSLFCALLNTVLFGALSVTHVSSQSGPIHSYSQVTVEGSGFNDIQNVYFGSVRSKHFEVISDNKLIAEAPVPPGPSGHVNVSVSDGKKHSAFSEQSRYTFTQGHWLAYLACTDGFIIPYALSGAAPNQIPLKGSAKSLAIFPNDSRLYVTCSKQSDHHVVIFDIAKNQIINTIPLSGDPQDIAISPFGNGYVIHGKTLTKIRLRNSTVILEIPLPFEGSRMVITPDNKIAYITHFNHDQISVVDLAANKVIHSIALQKPYAIGVHPHRNEVYVCTDQNVVYCIESRNNTITSAFQVGQKPFSIAVNPNGNEAYVGNFADNTVSVIQLNDKTLPSCAIAVGQGPISLAVTPDGKMAYVNHASDNTIMPIDLGTRQALEAVPIHHPLAGIVITPDQAPVANFEATWVGFLNINFDASSSVTPVGEITEYTWYFESLFSPVTTTSPFISHHFGTPGDYTVKLTVTNSAGTSLSQEFTGNTMSRYGRDFAQIEKKVSVPWPPDKGFYTAGR